MTLSRLVSFNYNKHLPTSYTAKSNDLFYILVSLFIADQNDKLLTKLTLEKSIYSSTLEAANNLNKNFFKTHFFINKLGPHNNLFYKYLDELQRAGMIEVNEKTIFITPRGLATISELLSNNTLDNNVKSFLKILEQKIKRYSENYQLAIEDTHNQKVIDSTDKDKIKSIAQIIEEIKPEERFDKASQFKYIETARPNEEVKLPPKLLNEIENSLANIEETDYQTSADISSLFA